MKDYLSLVRERNRLDLEARRAAAAVNDIDELQLDSPLHHISGSISANPLPTSIVISDDEDGPANLQFQSGTTEARSKAWRSGSVTNIHRKYGGFNLPSLFCKVKAHSSKSELSEYLQQPLGISPSILFISERLILYSYW